MSAICIIPARGGSVRIPRKNIKLFHGQPIIGYSILAARNSGLFDDVIVSTDDEEIAEIAKGYGASFHRRAPCDGTKGTQEVTQRTLLDLSPARLREFTCCLYATAPLMDVRDLAGGYKAVMSGNHTYALSVGIDPLRDAGQFYWGSTDAFVLGWPLYHWSTCMIPVDESRVCDINTIEDFQRAEKMYEALHA